MTKQNSKRSKEKERIHSAKYRQRHPGKEARRSAEYRQRHKNDEKYKDKCRARLSKYYKLNKNDEKYKADSRARGSKYRQDHPGREASRVALRRATIFGAKSERFTKQEIYERDCGICHLCGKKCDIRKWHLDHLIPLSLGGEHTRKNVAVSCPQCNTRKGNRGHSQLRLFG